MKKSFTPTFSPHICWCKKNRCILVIFIHLFPLLLQGQLPEVIWGNNYGATENEIARSAVQTSDGGFILAGYTDSDCGIVVGNHGGKDAWLVKITSQGYIEWTRCIGTTGFEEA